MPKPISAGLVVFRQGANGLEFLLVHPGGPFWRNRDDQAWSIPKGLVEEGEDNLTAAKREFLEETGLTVDGRFLELGSLKQKSGKLVHAWAVEADLDLEGFVSNRFDLEWPRGSGRTISVPEADACAYFPLEAARVKILPGQKAFIEAVAGVIRR